jgi:hypothetical protein
MSNSLIVIINFDNISIYGQSDNDINCLIDQLKNEDVALHCEKTAEGYLGVDMQWEGNQVTLLQQGSMQSIIEPLGLGSKYSTPTDTPEETNHLAKDINCNEASGSTNYSSLVGVLLYLGHCCPDISFVTHQRARYTHSPKQSHEDALNSIGHYLKGTVDKGLVLNPSTLLKID